MTAATVEGAVLFSDLVGFTEFNGARGDAAAVEVLDAHRRLMEAALVGVAGGRVVKELGDGLLVWAPTAEDGVAVASGFIGRVDDARACDDFPLAVRVGLHHGTVLPRGDDVVGHTVNVAARIVELAGPGEVLMSDAVLDACGNPASVRSRPIGPAMVKGVTDAVWLHRIEAGEYVADR